MKLLRRFKAWFICVFTHHWTKKYEVFPHADMMTCEECKESWFIPTPY